MLAGGVKVRRLRQELSASRCLAHGAPLLVVDVLGGIIACAMEDALQEQVVNQLVADGHW